MCLFYVPRLRKVGNLCFSTFASCLHSDSTGFVREKDFDIFGKGKVLVWHFAESDQLTQAGDGELGAKLAFDPT